MVTMLTLFCLQDPYDYSRGGNPTRDVFEKCIATLEGGKHGECLSGQTEAVSQ